MAKEQRLRNKMAGDDCCAEKKTILMIKKNPLGHLHPQKEHLTFLT
jgi:hypothetical protein